MLIKANIFGCSLFAKQYTSISTEFICSLIPTVLTTLLGVRCYYYFHLVDERIETYLGKRTWFQLHS